MPPGELLGALSDGRIHSGADLARRLGLTRAAIWKQVEHLRAQGVPVEARRGAGYSLPWPVQLLDAGCIGEVAHPAPALLEVHWSLDSTSSECLRRSATLPDASIVLSETQHAGRGRRGRGWLSPPGLNIYLSCLKRFDRGFAALAGLSLAVGVALVRALESLDLPGAGLKWPNDLLLAGNGAKLAGILVELSGEYQGPSTAVIGVGLNLRLPVGLRAQAGQPVADLSELAELAGIDLPDRNRVAGCVIGHLLAAMAVFDTDGFTAFVDDYARMDLLNGRALHMSGPKGEFDAVGDGVDARGALRVRRAGTLTRIDSADVTVRAR